jgi:hypothetical protein
MPHRSKHSQDVSVSNVVTPRSAGPKRNSAKEPKAGKTKDWLRKAEQQNLELQRWWVWYVFSVYALAIIATFSAIFLHGFHLWKFSLDLTILRWLGVATVGEIGGLVYLVVKFVFKAGL